MSELDLTANGDTSTLDPEKVYRALWALANEIMSLSLAMEFYTSRDLQGMVEVNRDLCATFSDVGIDLPKVVLDEG